MHYSVLVLTETNCFDLDEIMSIYSEDIDCVPDEHLVFISATEAYNDLYRDSYANFEEYFEDVEENPQDFGYIFDEERGEYGYWHNPTSEWDWYEVGGRWSNFYLLDDEGHAYNEGYLGELEWRLDEDSNKLLAPYAIIDIDGNWITQEETDFNTIFKEAIENNYYATIVDCHS